MLDYFLGWLAGRDSAPKPVLRRGDARRLARKLDLILAELGIDPAQASAGLPAHVAELVAKGQKIAAIKAFREATGAGLKEAKDAVEAGGDLDLRVEAQVDLILAQLGLTYGDDLERRVADLVRDGRKIEAVKLYRERTGAGLAESKQAVERLAAGS